MRPLILLYKQAVIEDDATGNEMMILRRCIAGALADAKTVLEEHGIREYRVQEHRRYDPVQHLNKIEILLEFESAEDLAMAHMVLESVGGYI